MKDSNSQKQLSGKETRNSLGSLLNVLHTEYGKYFDYIESYSTGAPNKAPHQFKMDAKLTFFDKEIWFIRTSSTIRTDRIKGNEFEAQNIKNIQKNKVIKFFYAVPDTMSEPEKKKFRKFETDIATRSIVTNYEAAVTFSELRQLIINKATEKITSGSRSNMIGSSSEKMIARAFKNPKNVLYWNDQSQIVKTPDYAVFQNILMSVLPQTYKISSSEGLTDSELADLKYVKGYGGKPKTDVVVMVETTSKEKYCLRLTVKQPSLNSSGNITVHQGYIENMMSHLEKPLLEDKFTQEFITSIKNSLVELQVCGGPNNLKKNAPSHYDFLNSNLFKINTYLIKYFIFGEYNDYFNKIQKANLYVNISSDTGKITTYTYQEVINKFTNVKKQFGTPFVWTTPSGKSGQQIQIKAPVL